MAAIKNELWCHECKKYVQFELDVEMDGNHQIECPECGHIHYRLVQKGRVTSIRYRSSMPTYNAYVIGSTSYSLSASSFDAGAAAWHIGYISGLSDSTG